MTLRIDFINMPFHALELPSVGVTQLRTVTKAQFGDRVEIDIHYTNHEFGRRLGVPLYNLIANSRPGHTSGFGEWFFRRAAFPEAPDNLEQYIGRYRHQLGANFLASFQNTLLPFRNNLDQVLDDIIEETGLYRANVVGMTTMFFQNLASIALARRLKKRNPEVLVVFGGANCEGPMGAELAANAPCVDFVFSGHSLVSFPQFIGRLLEGDSEGLHKIDGVFSSRNCRSAATLPAVQALAPDESFDWSGLAVASLLDGIDETNKELAISNPVPLDFAEYLDSIQRQLPALKPEITFETSRGCWWGAKAHCTFCGLNGQTMAYRAMPPAMALEVIEDLIQRYGDRVTYFQSVDNIMAQEHIDNVFGVLRPPPHIGLFYEVRANLTLAQLKNLAAAGVRNLQPGIESLSTSTLKLMKKGTSAFNNIRFLANCLETGVSPVWNLLVGFPGETADVYAAYCEFLPRLFHLPPPTGAYPVRFDRFSPYFRSAKQYGLKLEPLDYYGLSYPFSAPALNNMAYYFHDVQFDAPYVRDVAIWIRKLSAVVAAWRAGWAGAASERPQLRLYTNSWIKDTRGKEAVESSLSDAELGALRDTLLPKEQQWMLEHHGESYLSLLKRGLVFAENERVMNIVSGLEELAEEAMRSRGKMQLAMNASA